MALFIEQGNLRAPVTAAMREGSDIVFIAGDLTERIPVPDSCALGHGWGKWVTFLSEETIYDGSRDLWTMVRTPMQLRTCAGCGEEVRRTIVQD